MTMKAIKIVASAIKSNWHGRPTLTETLTREARPSGNVA